jgi:glutamate synthase domain-containing protein 1
MKKIASRQIIIDANQMLVRMSHRGGCGCEVNTGDGAGFNCFYSAFIFIFI